MDEDEEEEGAENEERINPEAILPRRTRGVRVDYTSPDALKQAGLNSPEDEDEVMRE
ncbi:hypothetical protein EI94DRAFT_1729870 [Lactarius quietus]|nr:hypothetical protein EI94DRAFT_1729870 [Lactarius quietus]